MALPDVRIGVYQPHLGRDAVFNIWDNNSGIFQGIKDGIKTGGIALDEAVGTANNFLHSTDPAIIKTGIHVYRLCMWKDPAVAYEWITKAPELSLHSHPRIRHSTIWNLRTASWQDPKLGKVGLPFAQAGLKDNDQGVQRASMWAHGDFVVNDPNLFPEAYASLEEFLSTNPKESYNLFALERFFRSLKTSYGADARFKHTVARMRRDSEGYPGLRARSAAMLDETVSSEEARKDISIVTEKYKQSVVGTNLDALPYDSALERAAHNFEQSQTFTDGLQSLKTLKYLAWLSGDLREPFEILTKSLTDKRDGDLARSLTVVMTDCTIRKPDEMAQPGVKAVKNFFESSDIDGSQIVIQLILDPIRNAGEKAKQEVDCVIPTLIQYAANRSVIVALGIQ